MAMDKKYNRQKSKPRWQLPKGVSHGLWDYTQSEFIAEDYDEIEREEVSLSGALPNETTIDFRFYYLDLLIVSRLIILESEGRTLVLQLQAESRDFDENELVFAAILKQIRESL